MMYSRDKYEQMLNDIQSSVSSDTDSITDLLSELGIKNSKSDVYRLILWNDHVNDIMDVMLALYDICKLSSEECIRVTMEAHNKGKSVVKTGSFDEMMKLKKGLNSRNLEATVEID